MTRLIHDHYVNAPVTDMASALAGAKRSLPAFGLALIILLAYLVAAFALGLLFAFLPFLFGAFTIVLAIGAAIFCLYLAFPYLLSGIVCITEELGPIASLGRSKYLTIQYRWPLLGMILAALLILAIYQVILFGIGYVTASSSYSGTIVLVVTALMYPLLGGWLIALFTIAAHRLRVLKDGIMSSRTLSNVFE